MDTFDGKQSADPLAFPLARLGRGETAVVSSLVSVNGLGGAHADTLLARLRDLGFVPGARCEIVARMWPAGDPLAVRIGGSTFALRRAEADAIRVRRLAQPEQTRELATRDTGAVAA